MALLMACGGETSGPTPAVSKPPEESKPPEVPRQPSLAISIVAGDNQRGIAGQNLPLPIIVKVRDESGRPLSAIPILFSTTDGEAGTPVGTTDADGLASSTWLLGWSPGQQKFAARIASSGNVAVEVQAAATPNPRSDVIVIRGAGSEPYPVVVIGSVPELYRVRPPDSLIYLSPRDSTDGVTSSRWVVAFGMNRPPALGAARWTPGIDTVTASFSDPYKISVTVWVLENFEQNAAIARRDVAATADFWRYNEWGLELGEVRIQDATDFANAPVTCQNVIPLADTTSINVYYARYAQIGPYAGFSCSAGTVLILPHLSRPGQLLLAHELGHSFGLGHDANSSNFMHPNFLGFRVTIGQIFNAHFGRASALNTIYRLRPPAQTSACCLPTSLTW